MHQGHTCWAVTKETAQSMGKGHNAGQLRACRVVGAARPEPAAAASSVLLAGLQGVVAWRRRAPTDEAAEEPQTKAGPRATLPQHASKRVCTDWPAVPADTVPAGQHEAWPGCRRGGPTFKGAAPCWPCRRVGPLPRGQFSAGLAPTCAPEFE